MEKNRQIDRSTFLVNGSIAVNCLWWLLGSEAKKGLYNSGVSRDQRHQNYDKLLVSWIVGILMVLNVQNCDQNSGVSRDLISCLRLNLGKHFSGKRGQPQDWVSWVFRISGETLYPNGPIGYRTARMEKSHSKRHELLVSWIVGSLMALNVQQTRLHLLWWIK